MTAICAICGLSLFVDDDVQLAIDGTDVHADCLLDEWSDDD